MKKKKNKKKIKKMKAEMASKLIEPMLEDELFYSSIQFILNPRTQILTGYHEDWPEVVYSGTNQREIIENLSIGIAKLINTEFVMNLDIINRQYYSSDNFTAS